MKKNVHAVRSKSVCRWRSRSGDSLAVLTARKEYFFNIAQTGTEALKVSLNRAPGPMSVGEGPR